MKEKKIVSYYCILLNEITRTLVHTPNTQHRAFKQHRPFPPNSNASLRHAYSPKARIGPGGRKRNLQVLLGLKCCLRTSAVPKLTTRRLPNQKEATGPCLSCKLTRNSCKLPLFTMSGRLPSLIKDRHVIEPI